ncbi:hypothetical protein BDN72DRAFT_887648 [Pluteus cervinus]|uniref:Uncharacterized protein n=1 Tax=Pluteus cervinus TaxID=181527 RepID=A0ACD3B091_9AGAR|nr:hypothetical protein BDN72DRAFT_887648 [Pluteus cervinus]
MDKLTSVIAALEAGKLPTTHQFNRFLDFLNSVITQVEPNDLTSQGRLLAEDLKGIFNAYRVLSMNKNQDNRLQEAIWHVNQGDIAATASQTIETDAALADVNALRSSLRVLFNVVWSSTSQEGVALTHDFFSFVRLALANAAEMLEGQVARAKDTLRQVEGEVQKGERDYLGRDKKRLEERSKSFKAQFEQGMDTMKGVGAAAIQAGEDTTSAVQDKARQTSSKLYDAFYKVCDKAQSDSAYQQAIKTIFSILQSRLSQSLQTVKSTEDLTTASFINDPTPEQHIPKAVDSILQMLERVAPVSALLTSFRKCLLSVLNDSSLSSFCKAVSDHLLRNLTEAGYARSEESQNERQELYDAWDNLLEKDTKWKSEVDTLKSEFHKFALAIQNDEDLTRLREAHVKLGRDVDYELVQPGLERVETGLHASLARATWFYQDFLRVYAPRILSLVKDIPIPRTEYVDPEIEFVLENLDISSCNLLPSHVYIRNITDVDFKSSASGAQSQTAIGTLTHIRIQALQLQLNDVSFYYKDKTAPTFSPSEYTGLIAATLPPEGITIELKIRLIPATHMKEREEAHRYTVLEHVSVNISQDIDIEVKNSNHSLLLSVFKPIMVLRLKDALERTLTEQIRWLVGWIDGIAWDIGRRREVFEDAGASVWGSLVGAIMSEFGRMRRIEGGRQRVGWTATGSGVIVEQTPAPGRFSGAQSITRLAMGAEPQILSGEKRGPLGTGSGSLEERFRAVAGIVEETEGEGVVQVAERLEVGVVGLRRARGVVEDTKRQVQGFRQSVAIKAKREKAREGWKSTAFDF